MPITRKTPVLVMGGGVSGLATAVELAKRGVASTLVENSPRLGGHAAGFCCKAAGSCANCGACRLGDLLREVAARPEISLACLAEAASAEKDANGGWQVELKALPGQAGDDIAPALGRDTSLECDSVILAVGHKPFDPSAKTRFGHGRVPGVMSALELEAMLGQGVLVGPTGNQPESVAFIQCVGSRDESLGHLWCSRACCGYALKLADLIKNTLPECGVSFFYMDLQHYGPGWEEALSGMKDKFEFIRAMPGEVRKAQDGAEVVFAGPGGAPARRGFDLVVLSVGLTPPESAEGLDGMFGTGRTADGFLGLEAEACQTGAPGVFVAGAARMPRSIAESIASGSLAAEQCIHYLEQNGKEEAHA